MALFAAAAAAAGIALWALFPRLLPLLLLAERLAALAAAVLTASRNGLSEGKLSLLLLILAVPLAGSVAAAVIRPAGAPPAGAARPEEAGFMQRLARLADAPLRPLFGAEYFATGADWRRRLLADIKGAKRSIFLEYYIVADGAFWRELRTLLRARAREGVDVRLLCDAFGSPQFATRRAARGLQADGIRLRAFRPLAPSFDTTRRDHRKLAVIDGETAYVGGLNVADEYVGMRIRFGHWKDSALRLRGPVARDFRGMFLRMWAACGGSAKKSARREKKSLADTAAPERICPDMPVPHAAYDGDPVPDGAPADTAAPERICPDMPVPHAACDGAAAFAFCDEATPETPRAYARLLTETAGRATRYLFCNTPYLILDGTVARALCRAAAAGTDVRIMIPYLPDKKLIYLLTLAHARRLTRGGVQIRAYRDGFLHAKSAVADDEYTAVGSYNLDCRSLYAQAECGAFVRSAPLARAMRADFLAAWEQGVPVKDASPGERLLSALLFPLSPLL